MNTNNLSSEYMLGTLAAIIEAQSELYKLIDKAQHEDDMADRARQAQELNRQEATGEHLRPGLRP